MEQERLETFLGKLTVGQLLDIGVGNGERLAWLLKRLPSVQRAVAVDVNKSQLEKARNRLADFPVTVQKASGTTLDALAESFDAVTIFNVFHHVPEGEALLAEAWRVLLPGGRLILSDCLADTDDQPQHNRLELHRLAHEIRSEPYLNRSRQEVLRLVEQLPAMEIEECRDFVPDYPDGLLAPQLLDMLRGEMLASNSNLLHPFEQVLKRIETEGVRHQNYIFLSLVKS